MSLRTLRAKHVSCFKRRASVLWRARVVDFVESGAGARSPHALKARECHHRSGVRLCDVIGAERNDRRILRLGTRIVAAMRLRSVSGKETLRLGTHPDIYN